MQSTKQQEERKRIERDPTKEGDGERGDKRRAPS